MPYTFRKSGGKIVGTKPDGTTVTFNTPSLAVAKKRAAIRHSYSLAIQRKGK